jgi:dTDP-glucose 4,6-dehydratase
MRYLVLVDLISVLCAIVLSYVIRYEALINVWPRLRGARVLLLTAPLIRVAVHYSFRLYRRVWRYASVQELQVILLDGIVGSILIFVTNVWLLPLLGIPYHRSYSILFLEGVVSTALLGGTRFLLRLFEEQIPPEMASHGNLFVEIRRRVLIAGAGKSCATLLREIQNNRHLGMKAIGLVDGSSARHNMRIYGVPVLGTWEDIPTLVRRYLVDEVIIATPSAPAAVIDRIYRICNEAGVPARELPGIDDLLAGTLTVDQLRQLRPSDGYGLPIIRSTSTQSVLHNILVTGGAGFIGSNFVRYMLDRYPNYRIVVYDKLTYAGNLDNLLGLEDLQDRYVFVQGDICDYVQVSDVVQRYDIDTIVNFAAESHVDRSLMTPGAFLRTNVNGTHTLLQVAKDHHLLRYHQVSTDEVYGQVLRGSFGEDDPLETRSPYSASKAGADLLVHAYYVSFGVPATITRGSNNIGPYQYPEKAVPLFITNALHDLPLPVYGDGLYVRDYQYVLDHCRGIDLVLHRGAPGEIYNLGSGTEVAALDLARMILDRLGKPQSLICLVSDRPGQDRRYSLNCAKIKSLGWEPRWTFDQALDDTINWYLENEWWWRKLKDKESEYCEYYEKQYKQRIDNAVQVVLEHPMRTASKPRRNDAPDNFGKALD